MDDLYVFSFNDRQQEWVERNMKDYKKIVDYPVKKILCLWGAYDGTVVFDMIGNGNVMQLIISEKVGVVWRELDSQESSGLRTRLNSPMVVPMNNNIFEFTKTLFKDVDFFVSFTIC